VNLFPLDFCRFYIKIAILNLNRGGGITPKRTHLSLFSIYSHDDLKSVSSSTDNTNLLGFLS